VQQQQQQQQQQRLSGGSKLYNCPSPFLNALAKVYSSIYSNGHPAVTALHHN
jgi:hypothetical protein